MSMTARRLIICCLGLLGALAAWPIAELILFFQGSFATYRTFLTILGAATGAAYGCCFGAAEGITSRIKGRIPTGMLLGAAFGCIGGAVGMLVGQSALWLTGDIIIRSHGDFRSLVLPVSRATGWAVLGLFVGAGEGIRAASPRKILVGVLGGLLGGLAGGLALESARLIAPAVPWLRLSGFALLGIGIAVFHALIERGMSLGVIRVLTGPLRGKEYIVNQRRLRLGRSRRNEIALPSYEDLAPVQARIRVSGGEPLLTNLEPGVPLMVNERRVEECRLRLGDVIRLGSARLLYRHEEGGAMRHPWIVLIIVLARPFAVSGLNVSLAQLDPSRLLLSQEVNAWVSVTDEAGSPVRGLPAAAFSLEESADGSSFAPVPMITGFQSDAGASGGLNFLLLIDNSGSMYDTVEGAPTSDESLMRITRAREAVREFLASMTNPADRVGLAVFNTRFRMLVPLTSSRDVVLGSMERISRPVTEEAYTELFASLRAASRDLGGLPGRKAIIVLSDGENFPYTRGTGKSNPDFGSVIATSSDAILACQQAGVTIYGISFGPEKERELRSISVQTGGVLFDAADQSELTNAYQAIRRQVAAEYRITYRSATAPAERKYVRVGVAQGAERASAVRFYFSSTVFGLPLDRLRWLLLIPIVAAAACLYLLSILKLERKPGPASLEVLQTRVGHPSTRIMPLTSTKTVIGSARDADLTIVGAPQLKDTHATILYDPKDGGYTVVSGGDIMVNNQPARTRKLEPGDVIDVGGVTIVFDGGEKKGKGEKPDEQR